MSFNSKTNHQNPLSHVEYYLGCDVAKHKLDVSLIDLVGNELQHGSIGNTPEAITRLLTRLADEYGNDTIACVIEATSIYHLPLAETAHLLAVPCIVYIPSLPKAALKPLYEARKPTGVMHWLLPEWDFVAKVACMYPKHTKLPSIMLVRARNSAFYTAHSPNTSNTLVVSLKVT